MSVNCFSEPPGLAGYDVLEVANPIAIPPATPDTRHGHWTFRSSGDRLNREREAGPGLAELGMSESMPATTCPSPKPRPVAKAIDLRP